MRNQCLASFLVLIFINFEVLLYARSLETVQGIAPLSASGLLFEGEGNTTKVTKWTFPESMEPLPNGTIVEAEIFWQDGAADLQLIASFKGKRRDKNSTQLNANWAMLSIVVDGESLDSFNVDLIDRFLSQEDEGVAYRLSCLVRQQRELIERGRQPEATLLPIQSWERRSGQAGMEPFDWWRIQLPDDLTASPGSFVAMLHVIFKLASEPEQSEVKESIDDYSLRVYDWAESTGLRLRKVASPESPSRLECFLDLSSFNLEQKKQEFFIRVGSQTKNIQRYKIKYNLIPYGSSSLGQTYMPDESHPEQKIFTLSSSRSWEKKLIAHKRWSQRTASISVYHPGYLHIKVLPIDVNGALILTSNRGKLTEKELNLWEMKLPLNNEWWIEKNEKKDNISSSGKSLRKRNNVEIGICSKKNGWVTYELSYENRPQWAPISEEEFPSKAEVEEIDYFRERAKSYQFSPSLNKASMLEVSLEPTPSSGQPSGTIVDLEVYQAIPEKGRKLVFVNRASGISTGGRTCQFKAVPKGQYMLLVSMNHSSVRPFKYRLSQREAFPPPNQELLQEGKTVFIRKSDYRIQAYGPAILLIQLYDFSFKTTEVEVLNNNQRLEPKHQPYGEFHELAVELGAEREHQLHLRVVFKNKNNLQQAKLRYMLQRVGVGGNGRVGSAEPVDLFTTAGKILLKGEVNAKKNDILDYWYLHQTATSGKGSLEVKLDYSQGVLLEAYDIYGKLLRSTSQSLSAPDIAYLAVVDLQTTRASNNSKQSHTYQIQIDLNPKNENRTIQVESDADRY